MADEKETKKVYVLVTDLDEPITLERSFFYKLRPINAYYYEDDLFSMIREMGNDVKVKKVFSVDEFGNVENYEVYFDGNLKLRKLN